MTFHKDTFHQKDYCNKEVTSRLALDLKNFIFYWSYGEGGKTFPLSKSQITALERARNTVLKFAFID